MPSAKDQINYRLIPATELYLDQLVEIGKETFYDTFAESNTNEDMALYLEKHFTKDQIRLELYDANNSFILLMDDQKLAGYAKVREGCNHEGVNSDDTIEIERLYIVREHQGKGGGAILMRGCLDLAKEKGFKWVCLGVWEHNPRAIAFYKKWGFEAFGEHQFVLGTDPQTDLLMKKKLL